MFPRRAVVFALLFAGCASRQSEEDLARDLMRLGLGPRGDLQSFEEKDRFFSQVPPRIPSLSDRDLRRLFRLLLRNQEVARGLSRAYEKWEIYDPTLSEIVRRGGPAWESELDRAVRSPPRDRDGRVHNLELLTALRRVQGRRDPLEVRSAEPWVEEMVFPDLPIFEVALGLTEGESIPVGIKAGGDYRSGRQARWRVLLQDSSSREVPVRPDPRFLVGGGTTGYALLKPGDVWRTNLDLRSFVEPPEPGEYRLLIQYHDEICIAGRKEIPDLILTHSKPIAFRVKPRTRETVKALLGEMGEGEVVKVLAASYGPAAEEFIGPGSPAGKILTLGWRAVPPLLDALGEEPRSPRRRAWVLALLFSITGLNDPREEEGVLPDHRSFSGSYYIRSGLKSPRQSWSVGWSEPFFKESQLDPEKQRRFSERWIGVRKFLSMVEG